VGKAPKLVEISFSKTSITLLKTLGSLPVTFQYLGIITNLPVIEATQFSGIVIPMKQILGSNTENKLFIKKVSFYYSY